MGWRTVVILNNDASHEWSKDPELGSKIMAGSLFPKDLNYGKVIELVHADTHTLMLIDSLTGTPVASGHWRSGQTDEERNLALLKEFADKTGIPSVSNVKSSRMEVHQ